MTEERREEIISEYAATDDPAEQHSLSKAWLEAGGGELLEQAWREGLRALRRPDDERRGSL